MASARAGVARLRAWLLFFFLASLRDLLSAPPRIRSVVSRRGVSELELMHALQPGQSKLEKSESKASD